jgi:probable rRNA maturation factor
MRQRRQTIVVQIANRQTAVRLAPAKLRRAVRIVLAEAAAPRIRISLAVVDDATIARLNWQFLRHRGPTDVLSFLLEQSEECLEAEIVACGDVARREAPRHGWTAHDELLLYVVHGALHLLGYDDGTAAGRARMRRREREVLAGFRGQGEKMRG